MDELFDLPCPAAMVRGQGAASANDFSVNLGV